MPATRHLDRVAFGLLAAAAAAAVCAVWPLSPAGGYDSFAYPKELVAAAIPPAALAVVLAGRGPAALQRYDLWLVGSLALGLLSALVAAPAPWLAGRSLALSAGAASAFVAARALAARGYRTHLEIALIAALTLAALTVVAEAHGLLALSMDGRAPGGTLGNRNYAAHLVTLGTPLLAAGAIAPQRGWLRAGHRAALIVVLHAIVLSHCRGAWLALLAAAACAAAVWSWRWRGDGSARRRALVVIAVAGVGIASAALVPNAMRWNRTTHLVDSLQRIADHRSGTGRGRLIQYGNTLAMIGSSPLVGVGPGNWSVRYPEFSGRGDPSLQATAIQPVNRLPSGDWLGLAAERGVPALLLLVGFAAALVARCRGGLGVIAVVPAVILVAAIMGSFDAVLLRAESALVLAILLGAFVPTGAAGGVDRRARVRTVATAALVALAAWLAVDRARDVRALLARVEGLEARPPIRGLRPLTTAAELNPGDYRGWALLAGLPLPCRQRAAHARATLRLHPGHGLARAILDDCGAGADASFFGQAQSWIEDLDGDPLIAANWSGEFRPYVFRGDRYVPLVADARGLLARVDLYRPLPIAGGHILMAGQHAGRRAFDLYLMQPGQAMPTNLTRTPDVDEGDACARPGSDLISFRAGRRQTFARAGQGELRSIAAQGAVPGMSWCAWLDEQTVAGIVGRAAPFRLLECRVGAEYVDCRDRSEAMRDIVGVSDLAPGEGGVAYLTAQARGRRFRTVFEVRSASSDGSDLVPVEAAQEQGDLLSWSPHMSRIGNLGRYRSSLAPASPATIFTVRRVGGRAFAIAADPARAKTLAVLEGGAWTLKPHPSYRAPREISAPQEMWTRSPRAERYQSFYFGPPDARRVVVWFHGGPRESVSPRFNPYFHALDQLGYAVMALNFPGSTGRGAEYEDRFADEGALADALESVWSELRRRGVTTVVSWSVSAGSRLPRVLLARGLPLSAIVDQAGFDNADLVALAARARVPVFAIRGRHDVARANTRIDYLYEGGHDITHPSDFAALLSRVRPFLESARPIW